MIPIRKFDKAEVLAALYNASHARGNGVLWADPAPMTVEEARALLKESTRFDYIKGRVLKVDLGGDYLDPLLYDRDLGPGAAEDALLELLTRPEKPRAKKEAV